MKTRGRKKKRCPSIIGRRTGVDVLKGKSIRKRDDGTDFFDDYFTDTDSACSDQTTQLPSQNELVSGITSSLDCDAGNSPESPRSPVEEINYEEEDDCSIDARLETLRRTKLSMKNSFLLSENNENVAFTRSKMTQTSNFCDETESSTSKNKTHLKEVEINNDSSSESENFSTRSSPRILTRSSTGNRMRDLPALIDDANVQSVSLSHERELRGETRRSRLSTKNSLQFPGNFQNFTIATSKMTQTSDLFEETENSSDSENSSTAKSPKVLSRISKNRIKDLTTLIDDANVSLPHEIKSGRNNKNKSSMSHLNENKKNEKNRKSSVRKSSIAVKNKSQDADVFENNLSKTSCVQSKEADSKRSSSKGRSELLLSSNEDISPQNSPKCPEHFKQKESVITRSGSTNRLENSMSLVKEKKRKSSVRKSSIVVENEFQDSHVFENNLSKTSCVQNREADGSEGSSSERRSPEQTTKSSKVRNQQEDILSGSEDSVHASEVLYSGQKENEPILSKGKSPQVPEHNVSQKSLIESLKAISPKNSAKRKIDFSEAPKQVRKKKTKTPRCGVRGSTRTRFPPLASWRNERLKYKLSNTGEMVCTLDNGQPEDDFALKVLKRRLKIDIKKVKSSEKNNKKNLSNLIQKTAIRDMETGEPIELNLHRPFSTCEWVLSMNDSVPSYMISKVFSSHVATFGFIEIAARSMKDRRYSPSDNAFFVVMKGTVDVELCTTMYTFDKGDSFIVPSGTAYSIANNGSRNALVHFSSFQTPIFDHQEI